MLETLPRVEYASAAEAVQRSAVEACRRSTRRDGRSVVAAAAAPEPIEISGIRLEPESNRLCVRGQTRVLRAKPAAVLWLLMRGAGEPVTREALIRHIWGAYYCSRHDAALRVYVHGLRRLIDADPTLERRIVTVRAAGARGYLFRP
jgi:DNA-binding response OmpR family regulator